jgi:hypothetical protein
MWSWSASARWAARLPTRSPRVACGCSASTAIGRRIATDRITASRAGDFDYIDLRDKSPWGRHHFDRNTKRLQVVDSTFYFFLKHANLREIEAELPNPLEGVETIRRAEILRRSSNLWTTIRGSPAQARHAEGLSALRAFTVRQNADVTRQDMAKPSLAHIRETLPD